MKKVLSYIQTTTHFVLILADVLFACAVDSFTAGQTIAIGGALVAATYITAKLPAVRVIYEDLKK